MGHSIYLADDEKSIRELLHSFLASDGYTVRSFESGDALLEAFHQEPAELVILDIMMPGIDGFTVCKKLREKSSTIGIIMLTARTQEMDKVSGLMFGADDYITKPFNILELKARIRALLRRANAAPQQKAHSALLTVGGVTIDPEQRVALKDGQVVELTAKEYDLIELFVKNPRRVYSRENLMDLVWGYTYAGDYRTVDVHIRRLREKLEDDPAAPQHILTKWGIGYYFKD